jgi:hypothetical protein
MFDGIAIIYIDVRQNEIELPQLFVNYNPRCPPKSRFHYRNEPKPYLLRFGVNIVHISLVL